MTHLDTSFHDHEMTIDTAADRRWSRWCADVERILDIATLAGDGAADGYSLDDAFDAYEAGAKPHQYAGIVQVALTGRSALTVL